MKEPTIFGGAGSTLFGGGEAGAEGIVPLQGKHMHPIADAIADRLQDAFSTESSPGLTGGVSNNTVNSNYNITINNPVPERASTSLRDELLKMRYLGVVS